MFILHVCRAFCIALSNASANVCLLGEIKINLNVVKAIEKYCYCSFFGH